MQGLRATRHSNAPVHHIWWQLCSHPATAIRRSIFFVKRPSPPSDSMRWTVDSGLQYERESAGHMRPYINIMRHHRSSLSCLTIKAVGSLDIANRVAKSFRLQLSSVQSRSKRVASRPRDTQYKSAALAVFHRLSSSCTYPHFALTQTPITPKLPKSSISLSLWLQ